MSRDDDIFRDELSDLKSEADTLTADSPDSTKAECRSQGSDDVNII